VNRSFIAWWSALGLACFAVAGPTHSSDPFEQFFQQTECASAVSALRSRDRVALQREAKRLGYQGAQVDWYVRQKTRLQVLERDLRQKRWDLKGVQLFSSYLAQQKTFLSRKQERAAKVRALATQLEQYANEGSGPTAVRPVLAEILEARAPENLQSIALLQSVFKWRYGLSQMRFQFAEGLMESQRHAGSEKPLDQAQMARLFARVSQSVEQDLASAPSQGPPLSEVESRVRALIANPHLPQQLKEELTMHHRFEVDCGSNGSGLFQAYLASLEAYSR
jgi:hypothetical protein